MYLSYKYELKFILIFAKKTKTNKLKKERTRIESFTTVSSPILRLIDSQLIIQGRPFGSLQYKMVYIKRLYLKKGQGNHFTKS